MQEFDPVLLYLETSAFIHKKVKVRFFSKKSILKVVEAVLKIKLDDKYQFSESIYSKLVPSDKYSENQLEPYVNYH